SGVSVLALPWPWRTPPCEKFPAETMIMFVPADWIWASIEVCAPVPSATIVMTAPTPMIMPSIVSAVRILLRLSALSATRKIMRIDMVSAPSDRFGRGLERQRRHLVLRHAALDDGLVRHHQAVPERHDSRA